MGINDRIVGKVMDNYIPKLITVITSMHGQMELQNKILQEIWVELKRNKINEKEARDFTDECIKEFRKVIEGNP